MQDKPTAWAAAIVELIGHQINHLRIIEEKYYPLLELN